MSGATVTITELGVTETTRRNGGYRFTNINPGTYTLRVRYFGLEEAKETIQVKAGSDVSENIALGESGTDKATEEVVVLGQIIERGQARAINDQFTADSVKTVISEELFGQVNDGNIATAMQRMPGLSADSNGGDEIPRYINIRGVATAFNSVQVDGARMPSSGTGRGNAYGNTGRGFALDDLPGDAIEKIEIIKAPTPDMDGAGLGGTVNLVTKDSLDYDGRRYEYKLGGSYNDLRDSVFPNVSGTFIDQYDLGAGRELGISLTGSYYETNEGFDNRDLDYNPVRPGDAINTGLELEKTISEAGPQEEALSQDKAQLPAVFYHEDTEYNTNVIDRDRIGFAGNFDLRWSDRTSFNLKTIYNNEDSSVDDRRYHKIMDNDHGDRFDPDDDDPQDFFLSRRIVEGPSPGPQVRLGSDPDKRSTIGFVDLNRGRTTLDADGNPRGEVQYDGQTNDIDIELFSIGLGGEHEFDFSTLSAQFNISQASKEDFEVDGDFKRDGFAFEYNNDFFDAADETYRVINGDFDYLPDVDPFELVVDETKADTIKPDFFQTEFDDSVTDRRSFKVDYEHELPTMESVTGTWKVGMKWANMEKDFDYTEVQYELAGPGEEGYQEIPWGELVQENPFGPVDEQPMPFSMNVDETLAFVEDPANQNSGAVKIDEPGSLEDSVEQDYKYDENVLGAYAMASFQAGPLEVIAGARYEHTSMSVVRNVINNRDDDFSLDDVSSVKEDRDYYNWLPAMHLRWAIQDNLLLRFARTKTIARPQILDLVNVRVVEEEDDPVEIDEGNFDLPPLESVNFDAALEYYPGEGLWSVGVFRKELENFSFPSTEIRENVAGFGGRQVQIKRPESANDALNQGVELQVFQRFSFLPAPYDGLFVNANYTYTDSDAEYPGREGEDLPTRGASKNLIFASLGYEWRGLSTEVQYRKRSPYIEGLAFVDAQGASDITEDDIFHGTETWNINTSYQVAESLTGFVNVTNLTNEENSSRQGFRRYPEDVYFNERRIAFGIKGAF